MNAKGSHVGVMLSFVIFITFIVFMFVIFEPNINLGNSKKSVLTYLEKVLVEKFGGDLAVIEQTAEDYNSDYEALKTELNVPDDADFAFAFIDADEGVDVSAEQEIPENIEIYIKEILVLYDNKNKAGYLTLKVW